jgi:nucleoside-diphosphate-sugar epimerase
MCPTKKKVLLVTGAAGFLGARAVDVALSEGQYKVIASDKPGSDLSRHKKAGARICTADLSRPVDCATLVKGVDRVCHMAQVFDLSMSCDDLMWANHRTSKNLVRASGEADVEHFLFCSTTDVYGLSKQRPVTETQRPAPATDFGFSLFRAEQTCRQVAAETEMPLTILRPAMTYGPGGLDLASLFCTLPFLAKEMVGFAPRFFGGPLVNAVHVDDVSGAAVYLIGHKKSGGETFNVSDNDWLPIGEFIDKIWEPLGIDRRFKVPMMKLPLKLASIFGGIFIPDIAIEKVNSMLKKRWDKIVQKHQIEPVLAPRFGRGFFSYAAGDRVFDNEKIKSFGYCLTQPNFDRGVARTAHWLQDQNWIPCAKDSK